MTDSRVARVASKTLTRTSGPAPVAAGRFVLKVVAAPSAPVSAGLARLGVKVLTRRAQMTWWDGTTRQDAALQGWWDGTTVQPVSVKTVT